MAIPINPVFVQSPSASQAAAFARTRKPAGSSRPGLELIESIILGNADRIRAAEERASKEATRKLEAEAMKGKLEILKQEAARKQTEFDEMRELRQSILGIPEKAEPITPPAAPAPATPARVQDRLALDQTTPLPSTRVSTQPFDTVPADVLASVHAPGATPGTEAAREGILSQIPGLAAAGGVTATPAGSATQNLENAEVARQQKTGSIFSGLKDHERLAAFTALKTGNLDQLSKIVQGSRPRARRREEITASVQEQQDAAAVLESNKANIDDALNTYMGSFNERDKGDVDRIANSALDLKKRMTDKGVSDEAAIDAIQSLLENKMAGFRTISSWDETDRKFSTEMIDVVLGKLRGQSVPFAHHED